MRTEARQTVDREAENNARFPVGSLVTDRRGNWSVVSSVSGIGITATSEGPDGIATLPVNNDELRSRGSVTIAPGTRIGQMTITAVDPDGNNIQATDPDGSAVSFANPMELAYALTTARIIPESNTENNAAEGGGTSQQTDAQQVQTAQQPATDASSDMTGRSLTEDEAEAVISAMERMAETAPELELTPENWVAQFGEDGKVATPIGEVKMGENQLAKLILKKRTAEFGMILPTISNPDVIIEKNAPADNAERNTKYLFVKTFVKPDGSRFVFYESVTVQKDGMEVSISSHEADVKAIQKEMQNGKILHLNDRISSGSERYLTETPTEERPDLVPTSDTSSTGKGTNNFQEKQYPTDEKGNPLFERMSIEDSLALLGELDPDDRTAFVASRLAEAQKAHRKALNAKNTGTDFNAIKAGRERIEAEKQRTETALEYWQNLAELARDRAENAAYEQMQSPAEADDYIESDSNDPVAIANEYRREKEDAKPENRLLPWQEELLTMQTTQKSFERFSDRNNITRGLARAWFSKDHGVPIDVLARELSSTGKTSEQVALSGTDISIPVSTQDVVDFILDHPHKNIRRTTDRFKEVAKADGYNVGNPDSATGKAYLEMVEARQRQARQAAAEQAQQIQQTQQTQQQTTEPQPAAEIIEPQTVQEVEPQTETDPNQQNTDKPAKSQFYSPKQLKEAYDTNDAETIATAENAMKKFIEGADDYPKTVATYFVSKKHIENRKPHLDKTSSEYKTYDFIIKTCKSIIERKGIEPNAFKGEKTRVKCANTTTDANTLDFLAHDQQFDVLKAVVNNPNTSSATLQNIVNSTNYYILEFDAQQILKKREVDTKRASTQTPLSPLDAEDDFQFPDPNEPVPFQKGNAPTQPMTEARQAAFDAVSVMLDRAGIPVETLSEEQMQQFAEQHDTQTDKKKAPETASVPKEEHQPTVVSDADGAKVLKNLDTLAKEYEEKNSYSKTFLGDVAKALGAERRGSNSQYATFETLSGDIVTFRLSDHNATTRNFDNAGEKYGISIVVSSKKSQGIDNADGEAHIVEFYYDAIKLRKAEGKPLADIVRAIKQTLYSGEYKDPTGLVKPEIVNAGNAPQLMTVYHGSAADFSSFDHSFMGSGEGAQAYGWGSYVTEVKGIGQTYAKRMTDKKYDENKIVNDLARDLLKRHGNDKEKALEELNGLLNESWSDKKRVKKQIRIIRTGKFLKEMKANLYTVEIPDDDGSNYLYWEAPVEETVFDENDVEFDEDDVDVDFDEDSVITNVDIDVRNFFGINQPVHLYDGYSVGEADPIRLAEEAAWYYDEEIDLDDDEAVDDIIDRLISDMDEEFKGRLEYEKEKAEEERRKAPYREYAGRIVEEIEKGKDAADETEHEMLLRDVTDSLEDAETGEDFYKAIALYLGDRGASEFLSSLGFTGISYPAEYLSGGRADNARNYVIFNERDLKITDHIRFLRTPQGTVYGATVGGRIYLNASRLNPETPIHEYTHIWDAACKRNNSALWVRGVELMKQTPLWQQVKADPNYSDIANDDNAIASEVHARLTGRDGAKTLEQMAEQVAGGTLLDRINADTLIGKLKRWLSDFWYWLRDTMTPWTPSQATEVSLQDFINMPLADLAKASDLKGNAGNRTPEPKAARIEKLRNSKPVQITGNEITPGNDLKEYRKNALDYGKKLQGSYTNKDTGNEIQLQRGRKNGGINEVLQHNYKDVEHLQSIAAIPQIIENSIYIDSEQNNDKKKNPNVTEYQHYLCGLKIGGVDYTVHSVIAVDKSGNRYYDHSLTRIEKTKLLDIINQAADIEDFGSTPDTKSTIPYDYKGKKLVSLLQTNPQKVSENATTYTTQTGNSIEYSHTGGLGQNDTGEFCLVEREFTKNGYFGFSGGRIKSAEDVAYIFRALEDKAVENAFGVLVNKGKPTIVHLGMGNVTSSISDLSALRIAYDKFGADEIYLVHNHPSGEVKASQADINFLKTTGKMFPEGIVQPGIIIDTTSGKFGVFDHEGQTGTFDRPDKSRTKETKMNVLAFDRQVFAPDYDVTELQQIRSSEDVAAFISSQRLGQRGKVSVILLNNQNKIIGNLHLPYNNITDNQYAVADEIVRLGLRYGANNVIPYGNFDISQSQSLERKINALSGNTLRLLDTVSIDNGLNTVSATDEGFMEDSGAYKPAVPENPQTINDRFNRELQQQIDGKLDKGHIYSLGMPGRILQSTGIPNLPIELAASRLEMKAGQRNHQFELSDVADLPEALQTPIAIFSYGDNAKAQNIIAEIEKDGKKFVVGLHLNQNRNGIDVNSIRGLFPKDNAEWLNWISQGKLMYADKQKIQTLIDQQRTNLADVEYLDLDDITKVIENFQNPSVSDGNYTETDDTEADNIRFQIVRDPAAVTDEPQMNDGETWQDYFARYKQWRDRRIEFEEATGQLLPELPRYKPGTSLTDYFRAWKEYTVGREDAETVSAYNREIEANAKMTRKLLQDMWDELNALKNFQLTMKRLGATLTPETDTYNRMFKTNSRARNATQEYNDTQFAALTKAMHDFRAEIGKSGISLAWQNLADDFAKNNGRNLTPQELLDIYVQARDIDEAARLGLPDRGAAGFYNNLGITPQQAIDMVEGKISAETVRSLWEAVNAATHFSLQYMHDAGMIDTETLERYSQRRYYVPERGWKERDLDERDYGYLRKGGGDYGSSYNPALVKSRGRHSIASSPFAYIDSIARSAILSAEKNREKQTFLDFVLRNEAVGTKSGAFRVQQAWLVNVKDKDGNTVMHDGRPLQEVTYARPTAQMYEHDKQVRKQVETLRKQLSEADGKTDGTDKAKLDGTNTKFNSLLEKL